MSWIEDIVSPQTRKWEEFYRNRFQHDRIVRSTHGVNCTGGCSWQIHVKDGIVVWETQQLDYPLLESSLPPYEPRGCQRGISFSWYLYSPLRIKYPLIRGALIDAWRAERKAQGDPVKAWASLQSDPEKRKRYQNARGKGELVEKLVCPGLQKMISEFEPFALEKKNEVYRRHHQTLIEMPGGYGTLYQRPLTILLELIREKVGVHTAEDGQSSGFLHSINTEMNLEE